MKILLIAVMLALTGCAYSHGASEGKPCVDQPSCVIGCIVRDNSCEKKGKDDGPG